MPPTREALPARASPRPDPQARSVTVCGTLFAGFAAAHLIDEFVWGAPAEFHLPVVAAEVLSLMFLLSLMGLVAAAARGMRGGYLGLGIAGLLIGVADSLKHGMDILAPGVWRSGIVSQGLAIGLTLAALLTAWTSIAAFRRRRGAMAGGEEQE